MWKFQKACKSTQPNKQHVYNMLAIILNVKYSIFAWLSTLDREIRGKIAFIGESDLYLIRIQERRKILIFQLSF